MLELYTNELRSYPIDAVREVLRELARRQQWWPTLSEVLAKLDRLVGPRRALRTALNSRAPAPAPTVSPPTAEEKAAVDALLAQHNRTADWERGRVIELRPMTARDRQGVADELKSRPFIPLP